MNPHSIHRKPDPREDVFCKKVEAVLVRELDMSFAEAVNAYRQIEADTLATDGDDAFHILEAKRRIAECILCAAHSHDQPFEVCKDIWNELLRLGFSNMATRSSMTWFYADCCFYNAQPDTGLTVLEPVIAEFQQEIEKRTDRELGLRFYQEELELLLRLQDKLMALKQCLETTGGNDEETDALFAELAQANAVILANSADRSFEDSVQQYRKVEADFVARASSNDFFVLETKRRTVEMILLEAHNDDVPFEVCQDTWNELLRLGFSNMAVRSSMTWFYANSCFYDKQPDAGLAVLEPLIAEFQQEIEEPTDTEMGLRFYQEELQRLRRLRDKLMAPKQ